MSAKIPVGNITAYAAAVKGGYTGTYEEFCVEQANFAKNAQQVAADRKAVELAKNTAVQSIEAVATDRISGINKAAEEKKEEIEGLDLVEEVNQLSKEIADLESGLFEDITPQLAYFSNIYVVDSGETINFNISAYWKSYIIAAEWIRKLKIRLKCNNQPTIYGVTFYSDTTPTIASFVGGYKIPVHDGDFCEFDNIETPTNAKCIMLSARSLEIDDVSVRGIKNTKETVIDVERMIDGYYISSNGKPYESSNYSYTDYTSIYGVKTLTIRNANMRYSTTAAFYDKDYRLTRSLSPIEAYDRFSAIVEVASNERYIRVSASIGETVNMFANGFSTREIVDDLDNITSEYLLDAGYPYWGEKIRLNNYFRYRSLGYSAIGQDAAQFGNILFTFGTDARCAVIDTSSGLKIAEFYIDGVSDNIVPHCNSAVFGSERYDSSDLFPLVYVNAYNNLALPKGTVYAHRIICENGVPVGTRLVQTITVGFTDNPIWTDGAADERPFGNFCVDTDNGYLYAYTLLDTTNVTRFFKFRLPLLSDGSSITLNTQDVLDYFDTEYLRFIQGCTYHAGKIYALNGSLHTNGTDGKLSVIDLLSKSIVSQVNFYKSCNLDLEPEFINIVGNRLVTGVLEALEFHF